MALRDVSASLEALAERVRPAVVQIFATGYAAPDEGEGTKTGSLLSKQRSTGSGVILSADGYIVTNNHVVQGARKIEVRLAPSGPSPKMEPLLNARVVGTDRDSDIAVIRVEHAGKLPTLSLADSGELRQGQLVMAFGNPLGLEGSVSMGVVSSTARQIKPDDAMVYVQTDAPINPGNSGGPLVDAEGRVVGINTFILTQSGGSEGIGFAVPSNCVRTVYKQIIKDGHVHRGQIGLGVQSITSVLARALKLPQDWGVIVSDVTPDGPADKAGIKIGDLVTTLNGHPMESARDVETSVMGMMLADVIKVGVWRKQQNLSFDVPVIEREDDPQRFADMGNPEDNLVPKLGILGIDISEKLSDMLPELRRPYGVVVARAGSPPYSGGALETGDVIFEINGTPAVNIKELRTQLDRLKSGDPVALQIQRHDKLIYVTLELE
jgi:serine protease Do